MFSWFRRKSRVELLEERYRRLMRQSFELSIKNPKKSKKARELAEKILQEIQYLSLKQADK
ncbi:MAG: hypothetical protein CL526_01265 [Aequorivita sp.]|nr:hypothetical protein [Aequorivita sp.]|tara:strand:- start:31166 stop:31348 length:183 start_codon:yes stop_codon:yes gene_type:complete